MTRLTALSPFALLTVWAPFVLAQTPRSGAVSLADAARQLAELPEIDDESVLLSPDGYWVIYSITRGSVSSNERTTELLLQRVVSNGELEPPKLVSRYLAVDTIPRPVIRWHPDSRRFSATARLDTANGELVPSFVTYDVESGRTTVLHLRDTLSTNRRPLIRIPTNNYQWSPQGELIAFVAPIDNNVPATLDPRRGVLSSTLLKPPPRRSGLFIVDMGSLVVTQLTSDTVSVSATFPWLASFAWALDGRAIAAQVNGTLTVIDIASRAMRSLGVAGDVPVYSPDGAWIAARGSWTAAQGSRPFLIRVADASVVSLPPSGRPSAWQHFWQADSKGLYFVAYARNRLRLFRATTDGRVLGPMPDPPGELPIDQQFNISSDGRRLVLARGSATTPAELVVMERGADGFGGRPARRLTQLHAGWTLPSHVRVDTLSWASKESGLSIHGVLLTPATAWRDDRVVESLPTVSFGCNTQAGPLTPSANSNFARAEVLLAARGFAVLCAMGRGSTGNDGFDKPRVLTGTWRQVYEDAMAGIDELIRLRIADSARLAIMGHSTDGMLAQYATVQTNRFKAAVIFDGPIMDYSYYALNASPGGGGPSLEHSMQLSGAWDMFDPEQRAQILAESPAHNADRVQTPSLMLSAPFRTVSRAFGAALGSVATLKCDPWWNLLQRFGVPAACFVYDEYHGIRRPAAVADMIMRTVEWLEYWVTGVPYPDPRRAAEYNTWRSAPNGWPRPQ